MIARWIVRRACRGRLHGAAEEVPRRAVAIALGAKVAPGGEPTPTLASRLEAARALHARGAVGQILVSGAGPEPAAMRAWLTSRGVPAARVLTDPLGVRTFVTMVRAVEVFGVRDAVVCTNAFHLPRAVFLARRCGIDAVGFGADRWRDPHPLRNAAREHLATWRALWDAARAG